MTQGGPGGSDLPGVGRPLQITDAEFTALVEDLTERKIPGALTVKDAVNARALAARIAVRNGQAAFREAQRARMAASIAEYNRECGENSRPSWRRRTGWP